MSSGNVELVELHKAAGSSNRNQDCSAQSTNLPQAPWVAQNKGGAESDGAKEVPVTAHISTISANGAAVAANDNHAPKKTLVIGLGAIGILGATALGKGTNDRLILVCRPNQKTAISHYGLHRTGCLDQVSLAPDRFEAFDDIETIPSELRLDRILVFVKCYDVEEVTRQLARRPHLIGRQTVFFCFQNGWGSHEPLLALTDAEHIYRARVITGATREAPNRTEVTVHQSAIAIGSLAANAPLGHAIDLAQDLTSGGVPACEVEDIDKILWEKLAYNAAVNGLGALHGLSIGELVDDPDRRLEMTRLYEEAFNVGKAAGLVDQRLEFEPALKEFGARLAKTRNHKSSMSQDLERNIPRTEVDWINGPIVRLARAQGQLARMNEIITEQIHRLESERRRAKRPQREEFSARGSSVIGKTKNA